MASRELWHFVPYQYDSISSGHYADIQRVRHEGGESVLPYGGVYGTKLNHLQRHFTDMTIKKELESLGIALDETRPIEFHTLEFGSTSFAFLKVRINVECLDILDEDDKLEGIRDMLDSACFANSDIPIFMIRSSIINGRYINVQELDEAISKHGEVKVVKSGASFPERTLGKDESEMILSPYRAYGIGRSFKTCLELARIIETEIKSITGEEFTYNCKRLNPSKTFVIELTDRKGFQLEKRHGGTQIQLEDQYVFAKISRAYDNELCDFPTMFHPSELVLNIFLLAVLRHLEGHYLSAYDGSVDLSHHLMRQDFDEKIITKADEMDSFTTPRDLLVTSVNVRRLIEMRLGTLRLLQDQLSEMKTVISGLICKECDILLMSISRDLSAFAEMKKENEQIIEKVTNLLPIFVLLANYQQSKIAGRILDSIGETSSKIQNMTEQIKAVQESAIKAQAEASSWSEKISVLSLLVSILAIASILEPFFTFYYSASDEAQRGSLIWVVLGTLVPTAIIVVLIYFYFIRKKSIGRRHETSDQQRRANASDGTE